MTTYTIDSDNNISAFASAEEAAAATTAPFDSFRSQKKLAEPIAAWSEERLIALWNSLPGVNPVKSFKSRKAAASRIWARIQGLGDAANADAKPAKPKADKKAQGWRTRRQGRAEEGQGEQEKATSPKNPPKAKTSAKVREATEPREQQDGAGGHHASAEERRHNRGDHGKDQSRH